MSDLPEREAKAVTRRDAIRTITTVGVGMYAMLKGAPVFAQTNAGPVTTPSRDPKFPLPAAWQTEFRKFGNNVYVYVQAGGPGMQGAGGGVSNAAVVIGDDHILLIDTMGSINPIKDLKTRVQQVAGNKPYGRVINTHQHADHTGGNQFFMPAEIVGHEFCRQTVLTMAHDLAPDAKFPDGTPRKLIAPTTTFTDRLTYHYGGTEIQLLHLGVSHTWGDLVVYIPEHKLMIASDIAFFSVTPFAHQGHVTQWLDVVDKIMAMDVDTIIPGHGPVGTKKDLAEMRDYFVILKREARKRFDTGMSPGKAAADIRMGKFDNWIGAERNLLNTFRLYCEFDGSITPMLDLVRMKTATDEYNAIQKARA